MSRLKALLRDLDAKKVVFQHIGDVSIRSSNIRWANTGDDEYQYIDLSSVDRLTGRIGETATINSGNAPSRAQQIVKAGDVIFATTRPTQMRWAIIPPEFDGQIASTGYCVIRPKQEIIHTNFLAHLLGTEHFKKYIEEKQVPGNYPSIPDGRVREYKIPVPPLEIQQEIVAILDRFTKLEAELEARRRQYGHYRDTLLSFPEDTGSEASKQASKQASNEDTDLG
ncbi:MULTISPECIES: restriction endonuclease subunit S [Novosphingobium]|uniref:restriction endonuclease subunit S n=1 Tax=Novosphingobium TaxID=165696 RepID=UPI000D6E7EAB|nr:MULTISPECIES: restriction endonuclease subunit S [Novosphingobium]